MKPSLIPPIIRYSLSILPFLFAIHFLSAQETEQQLPEVPFSSWRAERFCKAAVKDNILNVNAVNGAPVLSRFCNEIGGQFRITAEIRTLTESSVQLYWTAKGSPRRDDEKRIMVPVQADNQWHRYEFLFSIPDTLTSLAFQFLSAEGTWEVKSITVFCERPQPLIVRNAVPKTVKNEDGSEQAVMIFTVANNVPYPVSFRVNDGTETFFVEEKKTKEIEVPLYSDEVLDSAILTLRPAGFTDIVHPVFRYRSFRPGFPDGAGEWKTFNNVDVDTKGRMMRFRSGGEVIAVAAPLVHRNGVVPDFTLKESTEKSVKLEAPDCTLEMQVNDSGIRFLVNCGTSAADTLNIRLLGNIRNGLLSGIEFLGQGDVSSSLIDLEPPLNERSKPNPQWLTMPLAMLATDKGTIMLKWKNAELQPVFSSPNRFGFTDDHLMVLKGKDIDAILIMDDGADGNKSDDSPSVIHYQLKRYFTQHPFPDPPSAPRSAEEQRKLNLQALETLNSPDGTGWGYAVEPDWQREPFADFLSTQHRLTGKVPVPKKIVSGGSDIANDAAYFITNRVEEWLKVRKTAVQSILSLRQPDGSFLQRSRFPNIETKATSYGFTAIRALELMEFVRYTGDKELLSVVEKSFDYLKQCDVPRGGFYRDSPLHTPDLQTAASLVWLCVWAFEFTGKKEYLDEAERFAYLGLPFVYLDGGLKSAANYLTVPKLGGTERRKPLWFGVAKPQTGILYAYALNLLSKHNKSVDWKKIATGILYAAETLQYASGDYAGCLPERYDAVKQERESWKVNPCALVSLRLALEGKLDSLSVLVDGKERYVSPYPLRLTPDGVEVFDIPDTVPTFQILRNGNRIESVNGSGTQLLE